MQQIIQIDRSKWDRGRAVSYTKNDPEVVLWDTDG